MKLQAQLNPATGVFGVADHVVFDAKTLGAGGRLPGFKCAIVFKISGFSVSRSAVTLPPNPEPITRTSQKAKAFS